MPVYEYWCKSCKQRMSMYHATFSLEIPACPLCSNDSLQRLFSTFSVTRTDKAIYEGILNDSQLTDGMIRNDPRSLAEWNKRMSRGEKVAPEYEDMVGKMEKGEVPQVQAPSTDSPSQYNGDE